MKFLATIISILSITVSVQAETIDGFLDLSQDGMPYRLFVPADYDSAQQYPLVLWMHGAGGRETNNIDNISEGNSSGAYLCQSASFQADNPCFILSPQCPESGIWACSGWGDNDGYYSIDTKTQSVNLTKALAILDTVVNTYSIDLNRQYVTGQSMGGGGSWEIITRNPDRFAAAVISCGYCDTTKAADVMHMGIQMFHGMRDNTVKPLTQQAMYSKLIALGAEDVEAVWYDDKGHNVWDVGFAIPGLAEWMFSFSKETSAIAVPVTVAPQVPVFSNGIFGLDGRPVQKGRSAAGVYFRYDQKNNTLQKVLLAK